MADHVKKIAELLTEDPDILSEKSLEIQKIFKDYKDAWKRGSILSLSDFHKVAGALKKVAEKNGCMLDDSRLTVMLIPSGFVMKNIYIDCKDVEARQKLAIRLAKQSGDPQMKHKFDENLRVNLYNAINKDFANLVRDKFNLEVTHQMMDVGPTSKVERKDILPMATITVPRVDVEPEEEDKVQSELPPGPEEPLGGGENLGIEPRPDRAFLDQEGMPGEPGPGGPAGPGGPEVPPDEIEVEHIARIAKIISEDLI